MQSPSLAEQALHEGDPLRVLLVFGLTVKSPNLDKHVSCHIATPVMPPTESGLRIALQLKSNTPVVRQGRK